MAQSSDPFSDVPFETIEGLTISPQTDIPFGKPFRMGLVEHTIYDRAVEQGYDAGIRTHLTFLQDHQGCPPVMLDDAGFALMFKSFMPKGMNEHDVSLWRSSFIAGWASVFLGLVRVELESEQEGNP